MRITACGESEVAHLTRSTAPAAGQQISVQELIQRVRRENSPPPAERRVRAGGPPSPAGTPDRLTRWLVAGAAVVTALSAFALVSFVVPEDPAPVPAPAGPDPITFAGTRTVTETAVPPALHRPYDAPGGSYPAPPK